MSGAETLAHGPRDIRPLVSRPVSRRGLWIFAGAMLLGGAVLFAALQSRREAIVAPAIAPAPGSEDTTIASPPDLALPPAWQTPAQTAQAPAMPPPVAVATPSSGAPAARHRARAAELAAAPPVALPPPGLSEPATLPPAQTGPEVVYQSGGGRSAPALPKGDGANDPGKADRIEASRFANPSTTVPKGTVMQAVLESALDSTRAGMARAIVSHDVYGFDGTRILIPRGSRLIGEYKADVAQGQNRALIEWQRLMRPDGAIVNLDSPSADPLGRAGVKGKVHGHFLARYSGAILQTALDIGSQVAVNQIAPAGTAIYAYPGLYAMPGIVQGAGAGTGTGATGQGNVQPTLTVQQGTSVSVFVARDLDFTSVE